MADNNAPSWSSSLHLQTDLSSQNWLENERLLKEFVKFSGVVDSWLKTFRNKRRRPNSGESSIKCASFYKQELHCSLQLFSSRGCLTYQVKDDIERLIKGCNSVVENESQDTAATTRNMEFGSFDLGRLTNDNFVSLATFEEQTQAMISRALPNWQPGCEIQVQDDDEEEEEEEESDDSDESLLSRRFELPMIEDIGREPLWGLGNTEELFETGLELPADPDPQLCEPSLSEWVYRVGNNHAILDPSNVNIGKGEETVVLNVPVDIEPVLVNTQSEDIYDNSELMRYQQTVECVTEKITDMWTKMKCLDDTINSEDIDLLKTAVDFVGSVTSKNLVSDLEERLTLKDTHCESQQEMSKQHINPFDLDVTDINRSEMQKPQEVVSPRRTKRKRNESADGDREGLRFLPNLPGMCLFEEDDLLNTTKHLKWEVLLKADKEQQNKENEDCAE